MRQRVSARERLQITLRYTSPQVTNHAVTTTTTTTTTAAAAAAAQQKTDFLEQISNANLRFFIHPNFAFLSGPNKVDLRGISKLIEVK